MLKNKHKRLKALEKTHKSIHNDEKVVMYFDDGFDYEGKHIDSFMSSNIIKVDFITSKCHVD